MINIEAPKAIPSLYKIDKSLLGDLSIKECYSYYYSQNSLGIMIIKKENEKGEYFEIADYETVKTTHVAKAIKAIMDEYHEDLIHLKINGTAFNLTSNLDVCAILKILTMLDMQLLREEEKKN